MTDLPQTFDRARIAGNLDRRPADRDDFIAPLVLADLEERLLTLHKVVERALILAPDISLLPAEGQTGGGGFAFEQRQTLRRDDTDEVPELGETDYDLIVSLLDLQAINDVPGYLVRLSRRLEPDGLLLVAALGGESLTELRQSFMMADTELAGGAYARVAPFIPVREGGALLQRAGLALPVADVETHTVRYANALGLMAELKALGASNPLSDRPAQPATRRLLAAAAAAYQDNFADADGRVRATLEILWLSGWKPHESQPKPLRPGSAKIGLGAALAATRQEDDDKA